MKKKYSKQEIKKMFSRSTQAAVKGCKMIIKNPEIRKHAIMCIKAANGKKIRNTSKV